MLKVEFFIKDLGTMPQRSPLPESHERRRGIAETEQNIQDHTTTAGPYYHTPCPRLDSSLDRSRGDSLTRQLASNIPLPGLCTCGQKYFILLYAVLSVLAFWLSFLISIQLLGVDDQLLMLKLGLEGVH